MSKKYSTCGKSKKQLKHGTLLERTFKRFEKHQKDDNIMKKLGG